MNISVPEFHCFSLDPTSGNNLFLALLLRVGEGNSRSRRSSQQMSFAISLLLLENALDNNITCFFCYLINYACSTKTSVKYTEIVCFYFIDVEFEKRIG